MQAAEDDQSAHLPRAHGPPPTALAEPARKPRPHGLSTRGRECGPNRRSMEPGRERASSP
eukprot:6609941-Pyramimonas_sp.AAC.1